MSTGLFIPRRKWIKAIAAASVAPFAPVYGASRAAAGDGARIRRWVGIGKVCAWPKLERLADGTLVVAIFNQPCHGTWEGDLECWASEDEGQTWGLRSRVTDHEPTTVRMNCALGKARNGDLIVLCGGWSHRGPVGQPGDDAKRKTLRPIVCRSTDGGRSWKTVGAVPEPPGTPLGKDNQYIPFGQIQSAADGSLGAAVYLWARSGQREARFLRSTDDGKSWDDRTILNPGGNETALLHFGDGKWMAASREFDRPADLHLEQYISNDDARTWERRRPLTLPKQVPGHLLRLADGRTLLTYGNRCWGNYGIDARVSHDEGNSWGPPFRIADTPFFDSGYPSCAQLPGGDIATVYYTRTSDDSLYEMRVARWNPNASADMRGLV